jgi:AraC-like DNA-binding protein
MANENPDWYRIRGSRNFRDLLSMAPRANLLTTYVELWPPASIADRVLCLWTLTVNPETSAYRHRVLPDGCVDIVWIGNNPPIVAGPATREVLAALPSGCSVVGVRFRPGWAAASLGVPAEELLNKEVPLADVWGSSAQSLVEAIRTPSAFEARLRFVATSLAKRFCGYPQPHPAIRIATDFLGRSKSARVHELDRLTGMSNRQLQRRFREAIGYGPKTFQRIVRLQRLLALSVERRSPADSAVGAGYADQAHMCREVHALTGCTPEKLLPTTRTTLSMSDFFNTHIRSAATLGSLLTKPEKEYGTADYSAHCGSR